MMQHSTVNISVSFKVRMCKYLGIYALTRKRLHKRAFTLQSFILFSPEAATGRVL